MGGSLRYALTVSQTKSHTDTLLQFVSSQEELFYHSRDTIVTLLIRCLYNVNVSCNIGWKLVLAVMELIYEWVHRCINYCAGWLPWTHCSSAGRFVIPTTSRKDMMEYLVKYIIYLPRRLVDLRERAMSLLHNLHRPQYWGDLEFPNVLEKVLTGHTAQVAATSTDAYFDQITDKFSNKLQATFEILRSKPESWIVKHIGVIPKVLEPYLTTEKPEIKEQISEIFDKLGAIVRGGRFISSIIEKDEEDTKGLRRSLDARGFMGLF